MAKSIYSEFNVKFLVLSVNCSDKGLSDSKEFKMSYNKRVGYLTCKKIIQLTQYFGFVCGWD